MRPTRLYRQVQDIQNRFAHFPQILRGKGELRLICDAFHDERR
jgi:hypothetical protein